MLRGGEWKKNKIPFVGNGQVEKEGKEKRFRRR